jgi:hypothetical protein
MFHNETTSELIQRLTMLERQMERMETARNLGLDDMGWLIQLTMVRIKEELARRH